MTEQHGCLINLCQMELKNCADLATETAQCKPSSNRQGQYCLLANIVSLSVVPIVSLGDLVPARLAAGSLCFKLCQTDLARSAQFFSSIWHKLIAQPCFAVKAQQCVYFWSDESTPYLIIMILSSHCPSLFRL